LVIENGTAIDVTNKMNLYFNQIIILVGGAFFLEIKNQNNNELYIS
jgi:hypothetical protein